MLRHWPAFVLVLLLAAAAFARVHGAGDALVSFDDARQTHNATQTRATYYAWVKLKSDPERRLAEQESARLEQRDAPILQSIVAFGYMAAGGEHVVIARLFNAACWLLGGLFLYGTASWLFSPGPALIAVGYFLLLPFSVVASQAFLSEPLMIMLMIAGTFFIVRDDYELSFGSTMLAGGFAGAAILVKPVCAPALLLMYIVMGLRRDGSYFFRSPESYMMVLFSLAPAALYYVPALGSQLPALAADSFKPELLRTPEFWYAWRDRLFAVSYGPYVPAIAACGLVLAPSGRALGALWGLTLGYLVYGLAFTEQIGRHDYDHLQALPILALGLAGVACRGWRLSPRVLRPVVMVASFAGAVGLAYWDAREIQATAWPRTHVEPSAALLDEVADQN